MARGWSGDPDNTGSLRRGLMRTVGLSLLVVVGAVAVLLVTWFIHESWPPSDPPMFWVTLAAAVFAGLIVFLSWRLWTTAARDAHRAQRQSQLELVERLMTEYDQMRESIQALQEWKRTRGGADFVETFRVGLRDKHENISKIDEHRHRVSRFFVRLRRLTEHGFVDVDILRISLYRRSVQEVFLDLVDRLDEVACEVNNKHFGDADRKFYRAFLKQLTD